MIRMEPRCSLSTSVSFETITPKRPQPITQSVTPTHEDQVEKKDESLDPKLTYVDRLIKKLPKIDNYFTVHKKIGEGAFSNVFLATCKLLDQKKKFAIKHLTPTSHPFRIVQEMKCLQNIGGRDNVVKLECCLRDRDAIAFVMPYFPHDSFSQYVTEMSALESQLYIKNLLIALRRVHSFEIIHRDVKPTNFLYNRRERRFLLVDFGLAHKVDNSNTSGCSKVNRKRAFDEEGKDVMMNELKRPVLHSLSSNVLDHGDRAKLSLKKKSPTFKENSPVVNNITINRNINQVKRNLQFGNVTAEVKKEIEPLLAQRSINEHQNVNYNASRSSFFLVQNSQIKPQIVFNGFEQGSFRRPVSKSRFKLNDGCSCDKQTRICNSCIRRPPMHAPRAGTPGYRSPEVLLKYPYQTTAVDIWSAGIIMLSIMSGSYPFFSAPDDIAALMEMVTVFGTNELRNTANKLGRHLLTSEQRKPLKLNKLCEVLRRRSANRKGDTDVRNVDENTKQDLSGKKEGVEPDLREAKVIGEETAFSIKDKVTKKSATEVPSCHSCFQKILSEEDCLCSDYTNEKFLGHQSVYPAFPKEAYDLLAKLLAVDPEKRITADMALRHPFFQMEFSSS